MNLKREAVSMLRYISRLFVRKIFNRFFAALVASVLVVNLTIDSYAGVSAPTGSDWGMEDGDLFGSGLVPGPDWISATSSNADDFSSPDLQLAREMQERYEKSFEYCPLTLEDRLNQRIAFVDDLLVILALLLSACGIYLSSNDAIKDLFTSFEPWFRMSHGDDAVAMGVWETILIGNLGMTIVGMAKFLPILQEFLGLELTGYGTGTTDFEISISGNYDVISAPMTLSIIPNDRYRQIVFTTVSSPVYPYLRYNSVAPCWMHFDFLSSEPFTYKVVVNGSWETEISKEVFPGIYCLYGPSLYANNVAEFDRYASSWKYIFFLGTMVDFQNAFRSPDFVLGGAGVISIPADNVWTDLQQDAAVRYGDVLTIPKTVEAWEALKAQLTEATTSKDAIDALAPAIALEVIEGTKPEDKPNDKLFPWLPDITSPLTGITDALTGIKDLIITIPETLVNLKDSIVAIPGQITDFFTIDTAVIAGAFAGLQEAFAGRFSGIMQLANVFNRDYSFSMVYPVIKMAIPADPPMLRQMFGGKSEIIFLDLNPFADNFKYVRTLLIAFFYVSFAFWFLDEFDVKIHIG